MITQTQKYLLHFAQDTGSSSTRIISLSGSLDFGSVEVGQSTNVTLTISNLGNESLSITGISLPAEVSADSTSGSIAASSSQDITLTYTPTAAGTLSDSLVVSSDATSGVAAATLTGSATQPQQTIDADAQTYFSAVESAGVTLGATQVDAFDTFVKACKSANIWSKIDALYPMLGGTAATHAINAKNPGTYNLTWYGTLAHSAMGITGDGATGYGNTGIIPSTIYSNASPNAALSVYSRTDESKTDSYYHDIGVEESWAGSLLRLAYKEKTNVGPFFDVFSRTPDCWVQASSTITSTGLLLGNRYNDLIEVYHGSTQLANKTVSSGDVGTIPSSGAIKIAHLSNGYCAKNYTFCHVGKGMNTTEASAFIAAVLQLQTTLGRNI